VSDTPEAEATHEREGERSPDPSPRAPGALCESHVLRVRLGHGANCSSIGSLVDTMFAVAAVGGAVFASVVAAMGTEPVRVAGASRPRSGPGDAANESGPRESREPRESQEPREPP
jgi:hypothetical protein